MAFRRYGIGGVTDHPIEPLDPSGRSAQLGPDTSATEDWADPKDQAQEPDFEKSEAIAAYTRPRIRANEPKPAVRAEQIMSAPLVSVDVDMPIDELRQIIKTKRFRHIPVVSKDGVMCGIVSDRDLFVLSEDESASDIVESIMTKNVLTATPNTSIREIARVLFEERIGCMPIVDEGGVVVGMITRSDILRALIKHAPLDLWI